MSLESIKFPENNIKKSIKSLMDTVKT